MTGKIMEYQFNSGMGISSISFIPTPSGGGSPAWGAITGTLSDQTALANALNAKAASASLSSAAYTLSTQYASSTHVHSASDVTSSTFALARMGSGTPNVSTFLSGEGTWLLPVYANLSSLPILGTAASTNAVLYALTSQISSAAYTLISNYATAAQGTKADSAVQPGTLSSAAYTLLTNYATSTQGLKANTALQQFGYASGGGAVTQLTGKGTGVTLNTPCGTIVMMSTALAAATITSFIVTNSLATSTDLIYAQHESVGTLGAYQVTPNTYAQSSFKISVRNNTAGSLAEAIKLRFTLIKGVVS